MEKWKKRTVELLSALTLGGSSPTVVPYYPQKTAIGGREVEFFKRSLPEKKGISSRRLYNMLCELEAERRANIHSLMVLCGGEVICECYAPGYRRGEWHISNSMAKTICGMVIGRLVDLGLLSVEDRLVDIFPDIEYRDKKFTEITIDHLLSMTAGVDFAELGAVTDGDWTASFFGSFVRFAPGTEFLYNSMNSYILARVAERICSQPFTELADAVIFAPMGIRSYLWEKGPEGCEKGGWGLYMSPENWAKLGYMIASGGSFMGREILSGEWVERSTSTKAVTPAESGSFNYAYQMWVGRDNREILFNGMLGQNVWICPQNDIIVVMTAGNNELFQASPALEIVRKHLNGRMNDPNDYRGIRLLERGEKDFFVRRGFVRPLEPRGRLYCLLSGKQREPFDSSWNRILGRYALVKNREGIQPLMLRAMQNNMDRSIDEIELYRRGNKLFIGIVEKDESYDICVGLYGFEESRVAINGEPYLVRARAEAAVCLGEEYRIEMVFPETASTRHITIRPSNEGDIILELGEGPGHRIAQRLLEHYREDSGTLAFLLDVLERRLGRGEMNRMIKRAFNPTLIAVNTSKEGWEQHMTQLNTTRPKESGAVKIIRAVIDRLFKEQGGG